MPFHYQFGGIDIESDLALERLRPPCPQRTRYGRMRIVSQSGPAPAEDSELFRWPGRFGMMLGLAKGDFRFETPGGVFLVTPDGGRVRVFAKAPDHPLLTDLFVRRILPRMAKLHGGETYHAASLARDGKAILLFGPTGAGKSSMSIGLAATGGWTILGDDMALVRDEGGEVAVPSGADIAVWPSTSDALDLPAGDLFPLAGYDGKYSYRPAAMTGREADGDPAVGGVYFLSRAEGATLGLRRLPRAQAFEQALHQIVFLNPNGVAVAERLRSVVALNRMLARVPAWSLTYPSSYAIYPEISDAILATLDS